MLSDVYDLLVIGGGVNGAGIARDAAGRGLNVLLAEKGDLAEGTSSRSGKLIRGGLRYLEYYEFRLVREALIEREVLLRAAPHIVWPMRFVLPHSPEQRPAWLIRLGLFLYDHLGGRDKLPGTRKLNLRRDPEGRAIKDSCRTAFEYSDCWVEDSRLVVLNALDAQARGATILTRTAVASARRQGGVWRVVLRTADGAEQEVRARGLANAAGPWVEKIITGVLGANAARKVRLVKGSHIITRKWWQGPQAYVLQNDDKRVIFVNPYEGDLTLTGTTGIPYDGAAEDVAIEQGERDYLCRVVNRYIRQQISSSDMLHEYSGVRPLYDDNAENPSAVTRDYVFDVEAIDGAAPLLSVFGGKITTFRKLAEHAMQKRAPYYPRMQPDWTRDAKLPGGDLPGPDFSAFLGDLRRRCAFLPEPVARHYARQYGTRTWALLDDAKSIEALGRHFGGRLYEREADFLIRTEWTRSAEDVIFRRTKHHLHLSPSERDGFATWMAHAA